MSPALANLALLVAAVLWGAGNVSQKTVLVHIGPIAAVGLRCAIAALVMVPFVVLMRPVPWTRGFVRSSLVLSALFAAALTIQQVAYTSTSVTNASFLVNVGTIITPVLAWFWLRERPNWSLASAIPLAMAGALLMSGAAMGRLSAGDAACIASALLYAAWMVELGGHARAYPAPAATALVQFSLCALLCLPAGIFIEPTPVHSIGAAAQDLLILGVFFTAAAFGFQTIAQRHTPAGHAAVIVSAESVFGALGAFVILAERTEPVGILGGLLIIAGIVLISLWPGATVAPAAATPPARS